MNHISAVLSEEISAALQVVCPMFAVEDSAKFALELMVAMGITERSSPSAAAITTPPRKTTPVPPMAPQKQRARVVSKKMKDAFLAMPGASEDKLKDIVEKYKDASQDDLDAAGGTFEGYAKTYLAIPATEVTEKKDDDKKRFSRWSPASTKVFAEAVVANGGAVTNDLKKKFHIRDTITGQGEVETFGLSLKRITDAKGQLQQLIDLQPKLTKDDDKKKVEKAIKEIQDDLSKSLDEDKFALFSIQGHMTRFAEETFQTETEKDDDEDLEEFQFEDETLLIGTSSGKIYRSTPEAGDVLIGVAAQGRFKDVAIPKK